MIITPLLHLLSKSIIHISNSKTLSIMAALIPQGPKGWGYAIYRTVYTPESDVLWPSILSKLNAYVYRSIWYAQNYNSATAYPATQSFDYAAATPEHVCFKNIIMSDGALYANKSIDDIANFFSAIIWTLFLRRRG